MARLNLCKNPSFSLGLANWEYVNGSILSTTRLFGFYGSTSLRVDLSTSVGSGVQTNDDSFIPVRGGLSYAFSFYVLVSADAKSRPPLLASVTWYTNSGERIEGTPKYFTPSGAQEWERVSTIEIAPLAAVSARLSVVSPVASAEGVAGFSGEDSVYVGIDPDGVPYTDSSRDADGEYVILVGSDGVPYVLASSDSAGTGEPPVLSDVDGIPYVLYGAGSYYLDAVLFEQASYVGTYINSLSQGEENSIVDRALTPRQLPTVGGIELNADVMLGSLGLNTIDENGVVWVCTDIEGWWGHASPEIPDIARGVEDGSYDVTGRYMARLINLTGVFLPPNPDLLSESRDRLIASTNLVRKGAWLRTAEDPTRASFVRLNGRPQILTVNARGRTEFSIGLKAADPIKYEWNEADNGGWSAEVISGGYGIGFVTNKGTADVTGKLEITGPAGSGSTIRNDRTGEVVTLVHPLRRNGPLAVVTRAEVFNGIATLTSENAHQLLAGDEIGVSGVGSPFDSESTGTAYTVIAAASTHPHTFSFALSAPKRVLEGTRGAVTLRKSDVLEIDTYDRSVSFNGSNIGHRSKIDTLVDWVKFVPGVNRVLFDDQVNPYSIRSKAYNPATGQGIVTLTAKDAHFLNPSERVTVALAETAILASKQLVSDIVTLTTAEPHGFSGGDFITVNTTELSTVASKALTANVATLTTANAGGFAVSDNITVALATTQRIMTKALTGGVATISTQSAHAFSDGDSVTVSLPTSASLSRKSVVNSLASLTTPSAHSFSTGDAITVSLATSATVTAKATAGAAVTLTCSAGHGFSVGDRVAVAFPSSATLTGTRSIGVTSADLMTLNTTAAHGFSIGDSVAVSLGIPETIAVSSVSATTTECTITTSATHYFAVGETIKVTGTSTRFQGTFSITAKTANTVSYAFAGAAQASTTITGSVYNKTIAEGYQGTKVVQQMSATSLSFLFYDQRTSTSSTEFGASKSALNRTNQGLNGTVTVAGVPSSTQITYTKVGS